MAKARPKTPDADYGDYFVNIKLCRKLEEKFPISSSRTKEVWRSTAKYGWHFCLRNIDTDHKILEVISAWRIVDLVFFAEVHKLKIKISTDEDWVWTVKLISMEDPETFYIGTSPNFMLNAFAKAVLQVPEEFPSA